MDAWRHSFLWTTNETAKFRLLAVIEIRLAGDLALYGFEACSQADLAPNCSKIAAKCGVLSAD